MQMKPYPWKCPTCREKSVQPAVVDYRASLQHDGIPCDIQIAQLSVPRCERCGALVMIDSACKAVSDALRDAAGVLKPETIQQNREAVGLSPEELAELMGVGAATLERWESGGQIQSRCQDRLLRSFFQSPDIRRVLLTGGTWRAVGEQVVSEEQAQNGIRSNELVPLENCA